MRHKGTPAVVALGLALALGGAGRAEVTDGLVAHWKLDHEGADTEAVDATGNGNTGTLTNMHDNSDWVPGRIGAGALDFDGTDDYISLPDLGFSGNVSLSVAAWIRVDPSAAVDNCIFGFGNAAQDQCFCIKTLGDGKFRFYFWWNDLDVSVPNYYGSWTHVAALYDAATTTQYVYVNGALAGQRPAGVPDFQDGNYTIADSVQNDEDFDGLIDDVRVYNRALSAAEVDALYLADFEPEPPVIVTPAADPSESPVSPAWVEGTVVPGATSLTVEVNGGASFGATLIGFRGHNTPIAFDRAARRR